MVGVNGLGAEVVELHLKSAKLTNHIPLNLNTIVKVCYIYGLNPLQFETSHQTPLSCWRVPCTSSNLKIHSMKLGRAMLREYTDYHQITVPLHN